jgi:hypothetical protein
MLIFKTIEDAIITRLASLGVRTCEVYAGQMNVKNISDLTFNFPCIYLLPRGMDFETGNQMNIGKYQISLIIGDLNLRGSKTAVDGDLNSAGIYSLMQGIFNLLHDWLPVNGLMTPLKLNKIDVVDYSPELNVCIYAMDFTADVYYAVS